MAPCLTGHVLTKTRISVDWFQVPRTSHLVSHYFCTHVKREHVVGLNEYWKEDIYCSRVTAALLHRFCKIPHSQLHVIPLNKPQVLRYKPDPISQTDSTFRVTAYDANHCQGSVMFLFESECFGSILYTGNFRWYSGITDPLRGLHLDLVYFDGTYSSKHGEFISRSECKTKAVTVVRSRLADANYVYFIQDNVFGMEDVLSFVAITLGTKIHVSPERMIAIECMGLEGSFTTDESRCKIFLYTKSKMSYKQVVEEVQALRGASNVTFIKVSGLRRGLNASYFHFIFFSEHSSANEIETFFRDLKYRAVTPIVPKTRHEKDRRGSKKRTQSPTLNDYDYASSSKLQKTFADIPTSPLLDVRMEMPLTFEYGSFETYESAGPAEVTDDDLSFSPDSFFSNNSNPNWDDQEVPHDARPRSYIEPPVTLAPPNPAEEGGKACVHPNSIYICESPVFGTNGERQIAVEEEDEEEEINVEDLGDDNDEHEDLRTSLYNEYISSCEGGALSPHDEFEDVLTLQVSESEEEGHEMDPYGIGRDLRCMYEINQIFNHALHHVRERSCPSRHTAHPPPAEEEEQGDFVFTKFEPIIPKVRYKYLRVSEEGAVAPPLFDLEYIPGFSVKDRMLELESIKKRGSSEAITTDLLAGSIHLVDEYPLSQKSSENLCELVRKIRSSEIPQKVPVLRITRSPIPAHVSARLHSAQPSCRYAQPHTPIIPIPVLTSLTVGTKDRTYNSSRSKSAELELASGRLTPPVTPTSTGSHQTPLLLPHTSTVPPTPSAHKENQNPGQVVPCFPTPSFLTPIRFKKKKRTEQSKPTPDTTFVDFFGSSPLPTKKTKQNSL